MRHDHADPGREPIASRPEGWNREASDRRPTGQADEAVETAELAEMTEMTELQDGGDELRTRTRRAGSVAGGATAGSLAGSWQDIKSRFVDDPAGALAAAEDLVRQAIDDRVRALQDEAAAICGPQAGEGGSSTETMRTRLLRCQEYCDRLARSSLH
jgi:hypothetical protein